MRPRVDPVPVVRIDRRRRMRHGSHLALTIITGGLWGPAWWSLARRERRYLASLDTTTP